MRKLLVNISFIGLAVIFFSSCFNNTPSVEVGKIEITPPDPTQEPPPPPPPPITDIVSLGDLNKDGIIDKIMVTPPALIGDMECADSTCTTYFTFNSKLFPDFSQEQSLGGVIGNAGDLDNDGICEIYFVPDWFTSSWTGLNIYSLKNNVWKKIANASIRRDEGGDTDSHADPYLQRIIKHNKEYFEIKENVMTDGDEKLVANKFYFKK